MEKIIEIVEDNTFHVSSHDDMFSTENKKLAKNEEIGPPKCFILVCSLKDASEGMNCIRRIFKNVNVKHIEARKSFKKDTELDVYVEVEVNAKDYDVIVGDLEQEKCVSDIKEVKSDTKAEDPVPWFPKNLSDLDKCCSNVIMYGSELDADHPGFKDPVYRKRRQLFTEIAASYSHSSFVIVKADLFSGQPIPTVEYTQEEIKTWGRVYRELMSVYPTMACAEHVKNFPLLALHCNFTEDNIPQLEDISRFLMARTGFRLRPCAGFLSPRAFLASLAFRVFNCTQYIRHSSDPMYTPEPDICHELFGHVPLLADAGFAQFSQEIGLASLGATDDDVSKLAACYLYTIEFGLCREGSDIRAYGAGLLSSVAELKHALTSPEKIQTFEPEVASRQEFYVTTFQPAYFLSDTIQEAKSKMRNFVSTIKRPFTIRYSAFTSSVQILDNADELNDVISDLQLEIDQLNNYLNDSKRKK